MHEDNDCNSFISESKSESTSLENAKVVENITEVAEDAENPGQKTYAFSWYLNYVRMFVTRLGKDLFQSIMWYFYSDEVFPEHIVNLMQVQLNLYGEQEYHTISTREHGPKPNLSCSLRKIIKAIKTLVLSSEDDMGIRYTYSEHEVVGIEKEPLFLFVDTNTESKPSSKELDINDPSEIQENMLKKYFYTYIKPNSTNKESSSPNQNLNVSISNEEVVMVDINLQSDHDIAMPDVDEENNKSIVLSYLRNKDAALELEEISEDSLDVYIPSYPASLRSEQSTITLYEKRNDRIITAVEYLHRDIEFLIAAEIGNYRMLEILIRKGVDIQQKDLLGRNALHFAVCSNSYRAITILLEAGIDTNVKDNVGMSPLSLCLMRRPSMKVATLLFAYGAKILPRTSPMDTGLFIQFAIMCVPTEEESKILRLLIEKGALVNDREAPGGRQPLHFAAMSNNCKLIEILLDLGADLYMVNHRNETPRETAATFKCREAQMLLKTLEAVDSNSESSSSLL